MQNYNFLRLWPNVCNLFSTFVLKNFLSDNKMHRKAQHSNRSFMLGTLVLGILVIGTVIIFTALSINLSTTKTEDAPTPSHGSTYYFLLDKHFYGHDIDVYLNDQLLYQGTPTADTLLRAHRTAEDNAIIIVDRATEQMQIAEVTEKRGTFRLVPHSDGLLLKAEP